MLNNVQMGIGLILYNALFARQAVRDANIMVNAWNALIHMRAEPSI